MEREPLQLPEAERLRVLEKQSQQAGSGLSRDDLIGTWRLERIWGKGRTDPSRAAGASLRALCASLELQPGEEGSLRMLNSLALGGLKLSFEGSAHLKGRRPLMLFAFHTLRVSLAGQTLWSLTLPNPPQGREPFFALIASPATTAGQRWLAARGRGGGLALWLHAKDGAA